MCNEWIICLDEKLQMLCIWGRVRLALGVLCSVDSKRQRATIECSRQGDAVSSCRTRLLTPNWG